MQKNTFNLLVLAATLLVLSACSEKQAIRSQDLVKFTSSSTGIVTGEAVKSTDPIAATTVVLYLATKEGLVNFCTGSLIAKNLVLTAAHCVADLSKEIGIEQSDFALYVGIGFGVKIAKSMEETDLELRALAGVKVHPDYKIGSLEKAMEEAMHDVAILKLDGEAPAGYKPVKLNADETLLKKGDTVTLAGFGLTDGVKQTGATGLNKVEVVITEPELTPTQFGYENVGGKTACGGDSGGPAFLKSSDGSYVLVGVTSWGDQECKLFGAYSKVSTLYPFITAPF